MLVLLSLVVVVVYIWEIDKESLSTSGGGGLKGFPLLRYNVNRD